MQVIGGNSLLGIAIGYHNLSNLVMVIWLLALRAAGVSGWVGGRAFGQREIVCPGCISETVRYRKFILGRDVGWGGVGMQRHGLTLI